MLYETFGPKKVSDPYENRTMGVSLCVKTHLPPTSAPPQTTLDFRMILSLLLYLESSWRSTQASSISSDQCGLSTVLTFVQSICWTRELPMCRMTFKVWTVDLH